MADIKPIKPIKLCINITIPTIDDDSISLYECVGILGNKLQEAIQKINESLGSLEDVYRPENPPPYPVTSVNRAETKDVITVFEPEGGDIEDVSQAELIAAYKAGARLGAFNQDNGTCRLYHFNLYIDPERVDYKEVAGGGASGVTSVNGRTGAVNIFNAPISAATAASVTALQNSVNTQLSQLNANKVAYTDALTLEEIMASPDLTNKVAGAEAVKTVNTNKVAYTDALTLEEIMASPDLTNKVAGAEAVKTVNTNKVAYTDALTLEEIQASTDLTNKVASATAIKSIKDDIGTMKQGNFYTEKNKGNTMPADYGGFIRLNGKSWPGNFNGDTYYLGVSADSVVYIGIQINGAIQVTWTTI